MSDLPFWRPPSDFKMPIPSRARALLWGREARRQAFETEAGRELVATAYYDDGLVADGAGKYLLMTRPRRYALMRATRDAAERPRSRCGCRAAGVGRGWRVGTVARWRRSVAT